MQPKSIHIIYVSLIALGVIVGHIVTKPAHLRQLRWFQMALIPVLLCSLFLAGSGFLRGSLNNLVALLLLTAATGALFLTLTPNIVWLISGRLDATTSGRKPPLLDDVHIQPIRQLIAGDQFETACNRLEALLKNYRANFSELLLMAQLYHQVNRNKEAKRCLLEMVRLAEDDSQQLTAIRLYHQLA